MFIKQKNTQQTGILVALTTALFCVLLNSGSPTPLYPLYQKLINLDSIQSSFIFSSYGFGVLLALYLSRTLAINRENARSLLVKCLIMVAVPTLCFAFARSIYTLCLFRFISGLGAGTATVIVNILLISFSRGDSTTRAALLGSIALVTGLALGPMVSSVYVQLDFYPLKSPAITIAILVLLSAIAITMVWPKHEAIAYATTNNDPEKGPLSFCRSQFYLLALCVFISWSYAAIILSLGPTAAIDIFKLEKSASFGYVATSYLLIAGVVQLTIPRYMKPELTLLLGLLVQIFSMIVMSIAIYKNSLVCAIVSLAMSGFSYGAVFVGGAILINRLALQAPGWNMVSKFYFIVYLFNISPPAIGWLTDRIGVISALLSAITFFIVIYLVFFICALWTLALKKN